MAEDNKQSKGSSKAGETILSILGSLGTIAGPLIFGPEWKEDLGMPFKLGAASLQNRRMEKDLQSVLASTPETQQVLDIFSGITNQGGLINAIGNLNTQLPTPQLNVPRPSAPSLDLNLPTVVNAPEYDRMMAPTVTQPTPQAPVQKQAPIDLQSDDFLRALASKRPDLAEKILVERATNKRSPIDDIMSSLRLDKLMQDVSSFQTPEQKTASKLAETEAKANIYSNLRMGEAKEKKRMEREKLTSSESQYLQNANTGITSARNMLDMLNTYGMPTLMEKILSSSELTAGFGTATGMARPEGISMARYINQAVMDVVKRQSGVQYGYKELQWVKATQPSKWDTPELFRRGMSMALNTALYNKYAMLITKARGAGNAEVAIREGMSPKQIRAFNALAKQLNTASKNDTYIFADPKNAGLLEILEMRALDKPLKLGK